MECPRCRTADLDESGSCVNCGPVSGSTAALTLTLERDPRAPGKGKLFAGRFEVLGELGTGGMGKVFRAFDTKIKEEVALKLLKPEIAADKGVLERFTTEIRLARKIVHKNVCRMHDLHAIEGAPPFITMEYVEGEDLKHLLKREGRLKVGQAVAAALQIADGLAEAHAMGIVHRDLKPQNIMIDKGGNARILDFGIARTTEAPGVTLAGTIVGTPEYMSPEQVEGREADRRADIYSFGVTLYEMLTGRVPFGGDSALDIAHKQRSELPRDPRELNASIPGALADLVLRCLEKDRGKRFQSAEKLLPGLTAVNEALPAKERAAVRIRPRIAAVSSPPRPFRWLAPVVVTALAAGSVVGWLVLRPPRNPPLDIPSGRPRVVILPFTNLSGDGKLDSLTDSIPYNLNADLSQSKFLHVVPMSQVYGRLAGRDPGKASPYDTEEYRHLGELGHYIIQGTYTASGSELRINVDVVRADGRHRIGVVPAKGEVANWLPLLDELTKGIKPFLEMTPDQIAGDIDLDVGQISASGEPLRLYIEANKLAVIQHDWESAIETMEKAVALDPGLAMAYRSLHAWYNQLGERQKAREWLIKAHAAVREGRVSERERMFIESEYLLLVGRAAEAFEIRMRMFQLYPDDEYNLMKLAERYGLSLLEWEKAAEFMEIAVRNKTENPYPYVVLSIVYVNSGKPEEARYYADLYIRNVRDNAVLRDSLKRAFVLEKKYDKALAEAAKARKLEDPWRLHEDRGRIFLLKGDLAEAETEFKLLGLEKEAGAQGASFLNLARLYQLEGRFKDAESRLRQGLERAMENKDKGDEISCRMGLAEICLATGRLTEALNELTAVNPASLPPYTHAIVKARILAAMNSAEDALRKCEEDRAGLEKLLDGLKERRLLSKCDVRMAWIELARGNDAKAIEYGLRYQPWLGVNTDDYIVYLEPLARAYFNLGELENARREYELMSGLTFGRIGQGHIYAKSFYMLGQVYEKLGKKGPARKNFRKFLDLWKNADPGLPEVEDARKRLAAL